MGAHSLTAVTRRIHAGEIKAEKVGKRWQIDRVAFACFMSSWTPTQALERKPTAEERESLDQRVAYLHDQGQSPGQIATACRCSKPTVYAALARTGRERAGGGRPQRKLQAEARARRQAEAARLYTEENLGAPAIARLLSSSPTQISRDLLAAGVTMRAVGTQTKYAPAEARRCDLCGITFTPRYGSQDANTPRRYCCDEHAREARALTAEAAVRESGGLTTNEVADILRLTPHQVGVLRGQGRLIATDIQIPGGLAPVVLSYDQKSVERYRRERSQAKDGRVAAADDPDVVVKLARARHPHLTDEEEHQLRSDALARRRDRLSRRGGRPPAVERNQRWLSAYAQASGTETRWEACRRIALEDWQNHAEDWPREVWPAEQERLTAWRRSDAAERVLRIIAKSLQKATDKNPR